MTTTWGVAPYVQILRSNPCIQIRVSRTEVQGIVFYKIFNSYSWTIVVWERVLVCPLQSTFWNLANDWTLLSSHKIHAKKNERYSPSIVLDKYPKDKY